MKGLPIYLPAINSSYNNIYVLFTITKMVHGSLQCTMVDCKSTMVDFLTGFRNHHSMNIFVYNTEREHFFKAYASELLDVFVISSW